MTASPEGLQLPRLHLITDDEVLLRPDFVPRVQELLALGGARVALHVRGHRQEARTLWECARDCTEQARIAGSWLLVNDRVDIALGCGADGVQVGRASFPVDVARRLAGPEIWIGASVHDPRGAIRAASDGADFVLAGTLFSSATHPGSSGSGVEWLGRLSSLSVPVIGIGGITPGRTGEVLGAGAYGIAVIRGIWHAESPARALEAYLRELE